MTREGLSDFIYAAERSSSLRRKIRRCNGIEELFLVAKDYGFKVCSKDLEEDEINAKIDSWFEINKIFPIKS